MQKLVVDNIKADIARQIPASTKLLEIELTHAFQVRKKKAFKTKLQQNLQHMHNRLNVLEKKQQRAYG